MTFRAGTKGHVCGSARRIERPRLTASRPMLARARAIGHVLMGMTIRAGANGHVLTDMSFAEPRPEAAHV